MEPGATTRAVHAWQEEAPLRQRPAATPIVQTSTFEFDDMDEFARVAEAKTHGGYLYTRWANPTVTAAARTIAALEGAEASLCFASGMAAITTAMLAHLRAGDHVVSAAQIYGGVHGAMTSVLARAGIGSTLVDVSDTSAVRAAMTPRTKLLYCETMANPALRIADLGAWSQIARDAGAILAVDATFTPPVVLRPLERGVDLVLHSTTKYLGGHSDHVGGVVSGARDRVDRIHALQIDLGSSMAPFEAFLLGRGMQTLDLRFTRQSENALTLARWLEEHPRISRVVYPGLESHPDHALATDLFGGRFGGMLAIEVDGGREAGRKVMERVHLFGRAASLGGTKSLIVHPASVTHTQLDPEGLAKAGLSEGMLRVSVGIEDVADLVVDLEDALA